MILLSFIS